MQDIYSKKLKLTLVSLFLSAVTCSTYAEVIRDTINLGSAEKFAILSQSGITNVFASEIVGDVGTSPITGAALLLTCGEVVGTIFTVDAAGPACLDNNASFLTDAVSDMGYAYVEAAGRTLPDSTELSAGEIGGLTIAPGLHKWSSPVNVSNDITLDGDHNAVWIFQIAGTLNLATSKKVILKGGALAKNVYWQVAGAATIGTYAHFQGTLLGKTMIAVNTGATVDGRLLAQTAVTLQMNKITAP